jgi:hypothetical protein
MATSTPSWHLQQQKKNKQQNIDLKVLQPGRNQTGHKKLRFYVYIK